MKLSGTPLAKFAKALEACGYSIYYDIRRAIPMVRHDGVERVCDDRVMQYLRFFMGDSCVHTVSGEVVPYRLGKNVFYDLRDAHLHVNATDPFREYLSVHDTSQVNISDACIADYECKIDRLAYDVFETAGTEYERCISRMLILSAVWRTMEPGYKIDEVPVLQGEQGLGKDALLTSLVPSQTLYTTSFSFGMSLKEKIECTRGCVYVIASEMGGVTTTKDLEALKSYITASHDDTRLAYRRDSEHMPRRFVFVCTTNLGRPLPADTTGNRRWCVIQVGPSKVGAVEPFVEACRDAIWHEAVALYRAGVKPNLPRDFKSIQKGRNIELERVDEGMESAYESAVDSKKLGFERPYTLTEVAVIMGVSPTQEEFNSGRRELQHRVRDQLERQNWKSRRSRQQGGKVKRLWFPPNWKGN